MISHRNLRPVFAAPGGELLDETWMLKAKLEMALFTSDEKNLGFSPKTNAYFSRDLLHQEFQGIIFFMVGLTSRVFI